MDERLIKVLELKSQGMNQAKALKEAGVEYFTFARLCNEAGIPRRAKLSNKKGGNTYTQEVVEKVKKEISKGLFLKDICQSLGLDPRNLSRFCRITGLKLYTEETIKLNYKNRTRKPETKKRKKYKRQENTKRVIIIKALKKGKKTEEIVNEANCTSQYVLSIKKVFENDLKAE